MSPGSVGAQPQDFQWQSPRLQDCTLSGVDVATTVTHLVVNLSIIPLMREGFCSQCFTTMAKLCSSLLHEATGIKLKEAMEPEDPVLVIAISELLQIAELMCLLTDESFKVSNMLVVLDSVMAATTGAKKTMKQSITQCQSYKCKVATMKQRCQAEMTVRPEMDDWIQKCEESGYSLSVLEQGPSRVPLWQDKLHGGERNLNSTSPTSSGFLIDEEELIFET